MYQLTQTLNNMTRNTLAALEAQQGIWGAVPNPFLNSMVDTLKAFTPSPDKPTWSIEGLTPSLVLSRPSVDVLKFNLDNHTNLPPILLVAPLSGHYSTLLSNTVERLSKDFTVYITDWKNVRDTPAIIHYGLDDYVKELSSILNTLPPTHVMSVCQSCIPMIMALGLKATPQPLTLTLVAGPCDTRVNRTSVNEYCDGKDISWFSDNVLHTVPSQWPSAGAKVYAGFTQLTSFIAMNPKNHLGKFMARPMDQLAGDSCDKVDSFYKEYLSVMDLPSTMYLDTISRVFLDQELAKGTAACDGVKVDLTLITCPVQSIEGQDDDVCGVGQTSSALKWFTNSERTGSMVFKGCGHYGSFSGKVWDKTIAPHIVEFCLRED